MEGLSHEGLRREQPVPYPKVSSQTTWGTARIEMMADLTAGDRDFGWERRKEVGKRGDMNVETSVPSHILRTWIPLTSTQEAGMFKKAGLPQTQTLACQSWAPMEGWHIWAGHWGALCWVFLGEPWPRSPSPAPCGHRHTLLHFMLYRKIHQVGCRSASRGLARRRKAALESVHPRMA